AGTPSRWRARSGRRPRHRSLPWLRQGVLGRAPARRVARPQAGRPGHRSRPGLRPHRRRFSRIRGLPRERDRRTHPL
ncbi:MAG: hypothetical protein AVDCRST_MAG85-1049, partial [uncultured Solirubrobacteraceae bacterium]